ncbi:MAG: flagellar cap protein FliD N-terminal domain-containing protein [Polyangiaceae bacterium]
MSNITFGGFATGLDTNAIIDAFVKAERIPQDAVLKQKAAVDAASQTISGLSSKLFTLREAAAALSDPKQFASTIATSSDSSIVASAGTGAAAGRYEVQVTQLAKEQRTYGDAQSSGTTALGQSGTLSLTVGTGHTDRHHHRRRRLLVGHRLQDQLHRSARERERALDGTNYRLAVRLDSGSANTFSFTETGVTLGMTNPANPKQDAQDAIMARGQHHRPPLEQPGDRSHLRRHARAHQDHHHADGHQRGQRRHPDQVEDPGVHERLQRRSCSLARPPPATAPRRPPTPSSPPTPRCEG